MRVVSFFLEKIIIMMKLSKISIAASFKLLFAVTFLLLLATSFSAYIQNRSVTEESQKVGTKLIPSIEELSDLKSTFKEVRISAIKMGYSDKSNYSSFYDNFTKNISIFNDKKAQLCKMIECPADFDKIMVDYKAVVENEIVTEVKDSEMSIDTLKKTTAVIEQKMVPLGVKIDEIINQLTVEVDNSAKEILNSIKDATSPITNIVNAIIVVLLYALILSYLTRVIRIRIKTLADQTTLVSNGDLTVKIDSEGTDEISFLAKHFNELLKSITDIVHKMHGDASTLSSSTNELKQANMSISQASDDVLAQVMSVGAASEEMVSVSEDIARNCNIAAQSSDEARKVASEGMTIVHQTVSNIRRHSSKTLEDANLIAKLGEETGKIDSIISTIQDIASQTNLLALNAAIEAARAGEHGRGFAVVADEVRALAARTGESTKEISEMISNVQSEVKVAGDSISQTVSQMEQIAGEAESIQSNLEVITQKVNEVNSQITQIATATEEQTATSSEMSRNIQKITEFSQQVSNQAKDTCKNTSEIEDISMSMSEHIGKFKFED